MRAPILTMKPARAFRREMTLPEVLLWQALRGSQVDGLRFRRQHPVGPYVLDFYCPAHKFAIEVDGASHDSADRAAHDTRRDLWLREQGIRVLRFPATDVLSDERRADVLATVAAAAAPSTTFGGPLPFAGHPIPLRRRGPLASFARKAGEDHPPARSTRERREPAPHRPNASNASPLGSCQLPCGLLLDRPR